MRESYGQRMRILWLHKQTISAMRYDFSITIDVRSKDGTPGGHCLQQHNSKTFGSSGRCTKDICPLEISGQHSRRYKSFELNFGPALLLYECPIALERPAMSDNYESCFRKLTAHIGPGSQQVA